MQLPTLANVTASGATPERAMASFTTTPPNSAGSISFRLPLNVPIALRTALRTTISFAISLLLIDDVARHGPFCGILVERDAQKKGGRIAAPSHGPLATQSSGDTVRGFYYSYGVNLRPTRGGNRGKNEP